MNPFIAIFYSSLVIMTLLLWIEQRRLAKQSPELFQHAQSARQPWFIIDLIVHEQRAKVWFRRRIKPTLVTISLRILKITQSGLQSMRRWVRLRVERLSMLDNEHKEEHSRHQFFQKFRPSQNRG
jgi:hypothetical protein